MWTVGDRLTHRHNPELGPGRVVSVEGRSVLVEFPAGGVTLRLASDGAALVPLAPDDPGPTDARSDLVERLANGDVDPVEDFALRLDGGTTVNDVLSAAAEVQAAVVACVPLL